MNKLKIYIKDIENGKNIIKNQMEFLTESCFPRIKINKDISILNNTEELDYDFYNIDINLGLKEDRVYILNYNNLYNIFRNKIYFEIVLYDTKSKQVIFKRKINKNINSIAVSMDENSKIVLGDNYE